MDWGLCKTFQTPNRMKLQIRVEAINRAALHCAEESETLTLGLWRGLAGALAKADRGKVMPVAARGGAEGSSEQVVAFVRRLIERGRLKPGDRLPAERDLATRIGVSRPTVRAGLHSLAALGVVHSKHGSGTYIPAGPPALRTEPLSFLAALHGFTRDEMHEARRILEVGAS